MKLVYIWIFNYRDFIVEQSFHVTNDLTISEKYNKEENLIEFNIKENCKENLYGNNIIDVSAIVGKNGAGKTTVATMMMDYIPSNEVLLDEDINIFDENKYNEAKSLQRAVYIFLDDSKPSNELGKNISVFSRNVKIKICDEIKDKINVVYNYENKYLKKSHMIYLSNAFNVAELYDGYHERNIKVDNFQLQQMYTPSFLLKNCQEKFRKSFGYRTVSSKYLRTIQNYADNMSISDRACYIKRQEELFLGCYMQIPDDVKNELRIFKNYSLEVEEFAAYRNDIEKFWDVKKQNFNDEFYILNEIDQAIIAAKRIYILLKGRAKEYTNKSIWLEIYIILLSEIYLGLLGSKNILMHDIEVFANNNYLEIDNNFLDRIEEELINSELKLSPWCDQIIDCIQQIKKYYFEDKKIWTIGERRYSEEGYDESEKGVIEWYCNEIKKDNSFFKRNIHFKQLPTSSGELAFANLYAYINEELKNIKKGGEIILIIDEIDVYMHPRWQQMILNILLSYLKNFIDYKFQIIITTHSPIVLSDIPNDNIVFLQNNNRTIEVVENNLNTFGANIYDLYRNGFFLNGNNYGILGDLATEKIKKVENILYKWSAKIKQINMEVEEEVKRIYGNIDSNMISIKLKSMRNDMIGTIRKEALIELKECKRVIDIIGEQVIKNMLLEEYNYITKVFNINEKKRISEELVDLEKKFEKLSINEQNELIKYIINKRNK